MTLADLPGLPCPYCGRVTGADAPWARSAVALWGWCGVKLAVAGETAGVLLVGPMEDPAQAMLMSTWVIPARVNTGLGRQLLQRTAAGLVENRVRTVFAQGSRTNLRCSAPPRDYLRAVGFTRGLDERLWHLDLDRVVTERGGMREVFERLMGSLRPAPPEPAGGVISGRALLG